MSIEFIRRGISVLFFYPSQEKSSAELILAVLNDPILKIKHLDAELVDENSLLHLEDHDYEAVIVLYSPTVKLSENLFKILQYIDQNKLTGRFIFLPKTDGREVLPPIFHSIRVLQLSLYYFSLHKLPDDLPTLLVGFRKDWIKYLEPNQAGLPAKRQKGVRLPGTAFGLLILASSMILFLVGLVTVIIPIAGKSLFAPTPTGLHPPATTAYLMRESFQDIQNPPRWQVQHFYTGQQPLQTAFSDSGLHLFASPGVREAVYQLNSLQSWSIDDFQSLALGFAMAAMKDTAANNSLVFGVTLSEDSSYRMECVIIPKSSHAQIQCQVHSPGLVQALSDAIPLTLDAGHTATLVFDPRNYSLQFFLDDQLYGQRELQAVEYWRSRSFNVRVVVRVQAMNSSDFSCQMNSLDLSRQP